jgi:hypothetical protein
MFDEYIPGQRFRLGKTYENRPVQIASTVVSSTPVGRTPLCVAWEPGQASYYLFGELAAILCSGLPISKTAWADGDLAEFDKVRLAAESRIQRPTAEIGIAFAELGEVISMIGSPLRKMGKIIPKLLKDARKKSIPSRRGRSAVRSGFDMASAISNLWLQYRYGIMPLIKDIEDMKKLYANGCKKTESQIRNAHYRRMPSNKYPAVTTGISGIYDFKISWMQHIFVEESYSSHSFYRVATEFFDQTDAAGISPFNIIPIIYELIPYSFVVDWFIDFNTWLRVIMPRPHVIPLDSCVSVKQTIRSVFQTVNASLYSDMRASAPCNSKLIQTNSRYTRLVGWPTPAFPTPDWEFESIKHAFDSIALLWQKTPKLR